MLTSAAIEQVKRRLGFKQTHNDHVLEELQYAQSRHEQGIVFHQGIFLPWFLESEVGTGVTLAGEQRMPFHSDFLRELEEGALWFYDTSTETPQWIELQKDDMDYLIKRYPGSGTPKAYALQRSYARLFPTPDDAYTLKVVGYRADDLPSVSPDIENRWLKYSPFMLIEEATRIMAGALGNAAAEKRASNNLILETQRLFSTTEARKHANVRYVMGGED